MKKMRNMTEALSRVETGTWVRLVALILTMANMLLNAFGVKTLPVGDERISLVASCITAFLSALPAYWENNSFTAAAIEADRYLLELKERDNS